MSLTCTYTPPRRRVVLCYHPSSLFPALAALAALSFFESNSRPLLRLHQTQQDQCIAPRRLQPHKARAAQVTSLSWKYCRVTRAIVLSGFAAPPTALCSTTRPLHGHSIRLEDNVFLVTTPRGLSPARHCSFVSSILL